MGRLIDGQWVTNDLGSDAQGNYVRQVTQFRHQIAGGIDNDNDKIIYYPVEVGRYRLIVSSACGWSHRCLMIRAMKGLQHVIPVTYVEPYMGENGWKSYDSSSSSETAVNDMERHITKEVLFQGQVGDDDDDNNGSSTKNYEVPQYLHELYVLAKSDYTGRASVPVLWDSKTCTIVNNESSDLVQIFLKSFDSLVGKKSIATNSLRDVDLLPDNTKQEIQEMIDSNYATVNNGVYKCGFATTQEAYDAACTKLFDRLQYLDELLGKQRYLMGDTITLADICLFPTLYRFDTVYYTHFKCNVQHLYEYVNLWNYTREIYQIPGISDTCNMDEIKKHYYTSHESIHPRRYIPLGPRNINFNEPHTRDNKMVGANNENSKNDSHQGQQRI